MLNRIVVCLLFILLGVVLGGCSGTTGTTISLNPAYSASTNSQNVEGVRIVTIKSKGGWTPEDWNNSTQNQINEVLKNPDIIVISLTKLYEGRVLTGADIVYRVKRR